MKLKIAIGIAIALALALPVSGTISRAEKLSVPALVTWDCPATYDGTPQQCETASATDGAADVVDLTPYIAYSNNINAGTATAIVNWSGDGTIDPIVDLHHDFTIDPAGSTTVVACPASETYTGSALEPCTVAVTGAGGLSLTPDPDYANNTDAGTASATYNFGGDPNHTSSSDSKTFAIKYTSTVVVTCPPSVTYDGTAQEPCAAVATGAGGLSQSLTVSYEDNIDVGTATASADFDGDATHEGSSGSQTFEITKADAVCSVKGYDEPYTGEEHFATGKCVGVKGEDVGGLNLDLTANTDVGDYPDDPWTFTSDNYSDQSGKVHDVITKAKATCNVMMSYVGPATGLEYPNGACVGVDGTTGLGGLVFYIAPDGNTFQVGAFSQPGELGSTKWVFTGGQNYEDAESDTIGSVIIWGAEATCTVTGYTVPYDGHEHIATGSCTGLKGIDLSSGLDLSGTKHTDVVSIADTWTFTSPDPYYNNQSGTVTDSITKPAADCTITPYSVTYDGGDHTATGSCKGLSGEDLSGGLDLSGTTHTNAGTYSDDTWSFKDSAGTYADASGTVEDSIAQLPATCTVTGYSVPYDGNSHVATVASCDPAAVSSVVDLGGTNHTNAGDYPSDTWTLSTNYSASGTVHDSISQVNQSAVTVTGPHSIPQGNGGTGTATASGGDGTGAYVFTSQTTDCTVVGTTVTVANEAGTCVLNAYRDADTNYLQSATSPDFTVKMGLQAQEALTVTGPSTTITAASPGTATASGGSGTGELTFTAGGLGCTVSGTTVTVIQVQGGATCVLTARKAGDDDYSPISSAPYPVALGMADQPALTVSVSPNPITISSPGTLSTSGGGGNGAVTYTRVSGNNVCTVSGSTLTVQNSTGTCRVSATKLGDPAWNGPITSSTYTVPMGKADQTTAVTMTGPTVTITAGSTTAQRTATATGGNGTGNLSFSSGSSLGCSISGSTITVVDWTKTCALTATRLADNNYNQSAPSAPFTVAMAGGATQPTLTVNNPGSIQYGTSANLTTSGGGGTGAVTYNLVTGAGCTLSGNTVTGTVPGGACSVTATKQGDVNYTGPVTSGPRSITIIKADQSTLTVTVAPNPITYPSTGQATTSGGSGTGAVTYTVSNGTGCSVSNVIATLGLVSININDSGLNCQIRATKAGDSNYNQSSQSSRFTVNLVVPTTTTVTCPASAAYSAGTINRCTAVVTQGTPGTTTVSSPQPTWDPVTEVPGQTASVKATYAGNSSHLGSSGTGSYLVTKGVSTVTVSCPANAFYTGSPVTPCIAQATPIGMSAVDVSASLTYTNNINAGQATATATWAGDALYDGASGSATFVIGTRVPTCKVTGYSVDYDGNPHTATGTCTGLDGTDLTAGLNLSATTHTDADNYTDTWTWTDYTGTYGNLSGSVSDSIDRVTLNCVVTGYFVLFDGATHRPTYACGVKGEITSQNHPALFIFSVPGHSAVGVYNDDWFFAGIIPGNYNTLAINSGTVHDVIGTATTVLCTVTPLNSPYNGQPQSATGSCKDLSGATVPGLNLSGTTHTNAGTYNNDGWTFTDPTGIYTSQSGTVNDRITGAKPTCTVTGYAVPDDGQSHTATGACTGVNGESLGTLDLSGTTHSGTGQWNDTWSFHDTADTNYSDLSGTVVDAIGSITAVCTVTPYTVTYDGHPHTATGSCSDLSGPLPGLDLGGTTQTNVGSYSYAWTFNDGTHTASGTVLNTISKANPTCAVTGYTVYPDGLPHTATGLCTGVDGLPLIGLDLSETTHSRTSSRTYTDDWTFTDVTGNYNNASGSVTDIFSNSAATCTVTNWIGPYDGAAHTPSGSCTSHTGTDLSSGLNLGAGFTDVGTYFSPWTFTYASYTSQSGTASVVITQATPTVTVTCPPSVPYTGSAIEPCTAAATAAGGLNETLTVSYTSNTDIGTATASASYAGDANHKAATGSKTFEIVKAASTVTVTCPASVPYDGTAQTPCTAEATGAGMSAVDVTASLVYSDNTAVGTAKADASWSGDASHEASAGSRTFEITKASSAVKVTCPASVPYTGSAQTPCSAVVTGTGGLNETLPVSYTDNVSAGTATASASYAGDANYEASSDSTTFEITKITTTVTVTCDPTSIPYDGAAHSPCSAVVTAVDGLSQSLTVSYTDNVNAGTVTASASYDGDANHEASTGSATFEITKASSTVTVTCNPTSIPYDGTAHTPCSAVVTGAGGLNQSLTVSYTDNVNAGTVTATADYAGDANHEASTGSATFEITKAGSTVTVTCNPTSIPYDGTAHTPCTAEATGVGLSAVDLTALLTYSGNTDAGTATAEATWGGDANHAASTGSATFVITKASSTVTVTCDPTSVPFDGTAHTPCSAVVTGAGGLNEPLTVTYTDNVNVGTATARATYVGDANHTASTRVATFEITKSISTVTVTCNPTSIPYDGAAQTPCSAIVTGFGGLNKAVTVSYTDNVNAGTATANASYAGDADHAGGTGSATFEITKASSTVTVTCNPTSVPYDGTAQTPCSAVVTGIGGLNQIVAVSYTDNVNAGTATASVSYAGDANHTGSTGSATFEITGMSSAVTLTCPASIPYDGTAQTPCTAVATGAGGLNESVTVIYTNNVNVGTATANATYAGDASHTGSSGSGTFVITKADADCTIDGYRDYFDDKDHTAAGACLGAQGETLQGLDLSGTTHKDTGKYDNDTWSFTNPNFNSANGTVRDVILQAATTTVLTCPSYVIYNGLPQTPCTAKVLLGPGAAADVEVLIVSYTSNTALGTGHASAEYAGDVNHSSSSASASFQILLTAPTPVPTRTATPTATPVPSATPSPTATPTLNPLSALISPKEDSGIFSDAKGADLAGVSQAVKDLQPVKASLADGSDLKAPAAPKVSARLDAKSSAPRFSLPPAVTSGLRIAGFIFLGMLIFFMARRPRRDADEDEENTEA